MNENDTKKLNFDKVKVEPKSQINSSAAGVIGEGLVVAPSASLGEIEA